MQLRSSAFSANSVMPRKFTGEGQDLSPPLEWSDEPDGTREFALICDDPDAPRQTWVHWVLYKVPAGVTKLREGLSTASHVAEPAGALQGTNSWGRSGYGGPMPPPGHGVHHYHFKLYALDCELPREPNWTKSQLEAAIAGHLLGQAELIGLYERK